MHALSRFGVLFTLLFSTFCAPTTPRAIAATAPAKKQITPQSSSGGTRKIGEVEIVVDTQTIPVRVTGSSPELQSLAQLAFHSHGRYDVRGGRTPQFDIKFTAAGANQVRVDVARGSAPVASQVVTGSNLRNALLRAADIAVEKTNGQNLRGFFTARLAFISQRTGRSEVYASDLFLGEPRQLTRDGTHALTPRWTPDGRSIVYTSYFRGGAPDIYLLDPNSGRKDTFFSAKGTNSGARFSPNGQQVAMVLTGEGSPEIYVGNAQGRNLRRITRSDAVKSSPCWSPDGSQIIFAMDPGPQLYVVSAAGGAPRRIVTPGYTFAAEPDWNSVNRNKIACTVRVGGGRYQIAVVDMAANKATVVSEAAFDAVEPVWLADGRHLVYTARDRSTSVLCILDTETKRSTPITGRGEAALQATVWSQ